MTVELTEHKIKDVLVLRVDGRLDAASSPLIERKVSSLIEGGQHKLILNFENVDYLSSAGMRLLLGVTKRLKRLGGQVVLTGVTGDVWDVIRMAGFDRVLQICHTEQEAMTLLEAKEG